MAEDLLARTALLALALAAAGLLAHKIRAPPALGYLAAGIILSPHVLGRQLLDEVLVDSLAEIGVLVLLFLIGLELDLGRLREAIRSTALVAPFDLALPAFGVASLARLAGWSFQEALALGLAFAMSSTLFGERLTALPGVGHESRKRVLGVLVTEDVAAAGLLAIIVGLSGLGEGTGFVGPLVGFLQLLFFLLLLTAGALLLVPRILDEVARGHVQELVALWTAGIIALWGYLGYLAGSAELGAFVAGVAAAEAGSRYVARNSLSGIRDVALGVFFFASGLVVDPAILLGGIGLILGVALVFVVAKLMVHVPGAAVAGLGGGASLRTGFGLVTVGEFSLILAAVAESHGLAHPDLRSTVVGAMVILLVIASILMPNAARLSTRIWRLPKRLRDPVIMTVQALRRRPVESPSDRGTRRGALRRFISNVVLLLALALVANWSYGLIVPRFGTAAIQGVPWIGVVHLGIVLTAAVPLVRGAYRGYRDFVWAVVGLRPGEREGAGRIRERFVDALVAIGFVLGMVPFILRVPAAFPALVGGAIVAAALSAVAWRRLSHFHRALEHTLVRVLGEDQERGGLLGKVLTEYPWGVRFAAVSVPPGSPAAGRTIEGSRIRALTGAMVAVVQRRRQEIVNPRSDERIQAGDTLVLLGDVHQIARAEALLVAHGDALQMTVESRSAQVEEVVVAEHSPWAGCPIGEADILHRTGAMVAGVWAHGAQHPQPYRADLVLRPGDRLIIIGTALQVDRVKSFAEGAAA